MPAGGVKPTDQYVGSGRLADGTGAAHTSTGTATGRPHYSGQASRAVGLPGTTRLIPMHVSNLELFDISEGRNPSRNEQPNHMYSGKLGCEDGLHRTEMGTCGQQIVHNSYFVRLRD